MQKHTIYSQFQSKTLHLHNYCSNCTKTLDGNQLKDAHSTAAATQGVFCQLYKHFQE